MEFVIGCGDEIVFVTSQIDDEIGLARVRGLITLTAGVIWCSPASFDKLRRLEAAPFRGEHQGRAAQVLREAGT